MREVWVLAFALVLLAAAAAWSSFRGEVVVQPLEPLTSLSAERVDRLSFFSSTSTVVAERREDHWWMVVERKAVGRHFVASDAFEESLSVLTPVRPRRSLGVIGADKRAAFEIEPPKSVLVLEGGDDRQEVEIGDRTQVGQKDGYARRPGEEEIFIIDLAELDRLGNAAAFRRRNLRSAPLEEVASASIEWSEGAARARQRNRRTPRERFWATEASPDDKNDALHAFLEEAERLRIQKYPDPAPTLDDDEALMSLSWFDEEGEVLDTARVWKITEDDKNTWYVKSQFSIRPGEIVRAAGRELLDGLGRLPKED
ncbi:MAG: DUF4340 domain-containing protein [Myxococcota bacterium]